ncbi:DUF6252 family protein [Flavobacterium sp.]|uniref:DUF6252 family protein n=1 Tax=Flavobacterium sp. TaxID=239 RepID=UPI0025CEB11E|nr:DUF6252 family protein [Flavobacterium sp.]
MKTIKHFSFAIVLALTTILSSCSKSDSGSGAPATGSYILAKVDGANFTTVYAGQNTAVASKSGTGAQTLVQIVGTSVSNVSASGADSSNIAINLYGITAPGTYPVSPTTDGNVLAYTFSPSGSTTGMGTVYSTGDCAGSSGTITISSFTATQIEGTFSFTAKKSTTCDVTKTITNGSFRGIFTN